VLHLELKKSCFGWHKVHILTAQPHCVGHINKVKLRRARLVLGLVTIWRVYHSNIFEATQPGHPSAGRCNKYRRRCRPPLGKKRRVLRSSGSRKPGLLAYCLKSFKGTGCYNLSRCHGLPCRYNLCASLIVSSPLRLKGQGVSSLVTDLAIFFYFHLELHTFFAEQHSKSSANNAHAENGEKYPRA